MNSWQSSTKSEQNKMFVNELPESIIPISTHVVARRRIEEQFVLDPPKMCEVEMMRNYFLDIFVSVQWQSLKQAYHH